MSRNSAGRSWCRDLRNSHCTRAVAGARSRHAAPATRKREPGPRAAVDLPAPPAFVRGVTRAQKQQPAHQEGCLFCRRSDGGFTSAEHVFSRGLGNLDEYVLPPGVVCDRCNNGPLARVDREITDFEPIKLLRAERGLPTRGGTAVVSSWRGVELAFTAPRELSVFGKGPSPLSEVRTGVRSGTLTTTSPFKEKRVRNMARAIWKMALELMYLDHGSWHVFNPTYDPIRRHILGLGGTQGWLICPKTADIKEEIQLQYWPLVVDGRPALPVRLSVFGIEFFTDPLRRDLRAEDLGAPPAPANLWFF